MAVQSASATDGVATKELFKYPPDFPEIDGVIYLPFTTRELLHSIAALPVKDGDVFVSSYPKVGSTWVSEILWQICNGGQIDKKQILERIQYVDGFQMIRKRLAESDVSYAKISLHDFYRERPPPRIFKTHLQYHIVPKGDGPAPKPKYIYVLRNPKDCAVSYYHHVRRVAYYKFNRPWEDFFEIYIRGKVDFGSWFDHVLGWWAHRDDPNILFVKYEDMKKDLESAVRKIAEFVGKELTVEMIQQIAKQTTFDVMKSGDQFSRGTLPFGGPEETKFVRKGVVGDWRNYFTEEQNQRFDKMYTERMAGSGLEVEF